MAAELRLRVLVVEDEADLVELLRYNLAKAGFDVATAHDGEEALTQISESAPDIIVLDWMLPHVSGLEVCRRLRRNPATKRIPVIMLTARTQEEDRVRGLESGADDYVVKPFSPGELVARVRAVLRRTRSAAAGEALEAGGVTLDPATHRVQRDGRRLALGPTEFRLLRTLMEVRGRVLSREQLLDLVWGRDTEIDLRTVDAHIRRLRRAINGPGEADLIRTVRQAGYAFEVAAESAGAG